MCYSLCYISDQDSFLSYPHLGSPHCLHLDSGNDHYYWHCIVHTDSQHALHCFDRLYCYTVVTTHCCCHRHPDTHWCSLIVVVIVNHHAAITITISKLAWRMSSHVCCNLLSSAFLLLVIASVIINVVVNVNNISTAFVKIVVIFVVAVRAFY